MKSCAASCPIILSSVTITFFIYLNDNVVLNVFFSSGYSKEDFCLQHMAKIIFDKLMELL